jgi:hypothetical protein
MMDLRRMVALAALLALVLRPAAGHGSESALAGHAGILSLADGALSIGPVVEEHATGTDSANSTDEHLHHVKELTAPIPLGSFTDQEGSEGSIDLSAPGFATVPVPEPATIAIAASSLFGVTFFRRRHYSDRSIAAVFWLGFSLVAACIAFSILPAGVACFVAGVPALFYLGALIWFGADVAGSALLLAIVLFLNVALLGQAMAKAML